MSLHYEQSAICKRCGKEMLTSVKFNGGEYILVCLPCAAKELRSRIPRPAPKRE